MSEYETLQSLLPYVPLYWARQALLDPEHTLVGREERFYAAVLFVDISGFTRISEALSRKGNEGVQELLDDILERYFAVMAEPVLAYGGEVVKFAGDSLIVIFPAQMDRGEAHLGSAIQCSLRMQDAMSEFAEVETSAGTFPLRMKIGVGEGALYNTAVGDEARGMQFVLAGLPLARCQEAEDMAAAGEIVVDAGLLSRMPGRLDIGEARGTFRLVSGATDVPVLPPSRLPNVSRFTAERAELVIRRLSPCLPGQLVENIRQGRRGVLAEYRRVTVMFVKFGGLNYDWDPDVGTVLQIYFNTMRDCVSRYGGRLNEVDIVSDGGTLVVFFGAPTAHEDHQRRAVACAWEMQQAVATVRLEGGEPAERLRQCIGISSGPVFIGDIGAPVRRVYSAVGDEVNLSARLMDLAQWGEIVASGDVHRRIEGYFEFEAMGKVWVKNKVEPVSVYALLGPRQQSTGDGLVSQLMDRRPLVGREDELAILDAVSEQAWQGHPQLVLITGEAGLGKSRLVGELMQRWLGRGGRAYVSDCRGQEGLHDTYVPWSSLLGTVFGLSDTDSPERQREKIETLLTFMSPSLVERADLFGDLLQVDIPQDPFGPILSPEERRSQLHGLLRDFFRLISQRQPLLLVFENLHDIDDASLSLLNDLLDGLAGFPLLICGAYRPRGDLRLAEQAIPTTLLALEELSEDDSLTLAQSLIGDVGLSVDLAQQIATQTYGNPFYLQEMVHALAEAVPSGTQDAAETLSQGLIVPESISDMIQAQLSRLEEDLKLTLRTAAVIGCQFGFRVLLEAHPEALSQARLSAHLATLERMHILSLAHFGEDIGYRFRQPMAQQVIYASMLRADRERIHRRVGEALEKVYANDLASQYSVVADHFYRGQVPQKTVVYLVLSGDLAAGARDDREALVHYDRAEAILSECEACAPRCVQGTRLAILLRRGRTHYRLMNIAEAIDDSRRASELAGHLADLRSKGEALLSQGEIALHQARYLDATVLLRYAMQPFSALQDHGAMSRALLLEARLHALQGRYEEAARLVERAVVLEDEVEDEVGLAHCRSLQGMFDYASGRHRQASDTLRRAVQLAQRAGAQDVVVQSLLGLARALLSRGRWGQAVQTCREGLETSQTLGMPLLVADAKRVLALVLSWVGAYEEAYEVLRDVLAALANAEWRVELASAFWISGETCLALGSYDEARERFDNALMLGRESNTVGPIVHAQLGLSKLAAVEENWPQAQRLCTEARARARRAGLELTVVAARLELARAYTARGDWRRAQHEASQALDASTRLRCPYETFRASAILGEVLTALGQSSRGQQHLEEAGAIARRLADTLPQPLARAFLDRPDVRAVCNSRDGQWTSEVA
jgi:class 3 adenylate cyclase/tetratricopeptide (TPR) repeat protein